MNRNFLQINGLQFKVRPEANNSTGYLTGSVALSPGESLIIVGPAGCGKTHMAHCLAGLAEPGEWCGAVSVENQEIQSLTPVTRAELIALVPSNPALVFSCISKSILREMELSFEFLGRGIDASAIDELLDRLELRSLAGRDPLTLSGGEKIRAALAVCLAKSPKILIVDQVFEEVDRVSERLIRSILNEHKYRDGLVVIEFHTRAPIASDLASQQWLFVTAAGMIQGDFNACWSQVSQHAANLLSQYPRIGANLQKRHQIIFPSPPTSAEHIAELFALKMAAGKELSDKADGCEEETVRRAATVENLEFNYTGQTAFHLGPINHTFAAGRATAVLGRNGAGKTTLLRCLGNLNQGWQGEIILEQGRPAKTDPLHVWARHATYCFQNPDDQIFFTTVKAELAETAQRIRVGNYAVEQELMRVAEGLGLDSLLNVSPLDLPRSYRRLVTLGSALVAAPPMLLLDEPTGGIDWRMAERLLSLLQHYLEAKGTIVMVSHDQDFVTEIADDILVLENGKTKSVGSRKKGFTDWPENFKPGVPAAALCQGLPPQVWRETEYGGSISPKHSG